MGQRVSVILHADGSANVEVNIDEVIVPSVMRTPAHVTVEAIESAEIQSIPKTSRRKKSVRR